MKEKDILLTAATLPKYARKEYLVIEQGKSGYSLNTFLQFLTECAVDYNKRIEGIVNERNALAVDAGYGNIYSLSGYSIPEIILIDNNQVKVNVNTQLLHELLSDIKEIATGKPIESPKEQKPVAPVIGLFCQLVNDLEILKRGSETVAIYCQQVCEKFGLIYTDRVRQCYPHKPTKEHTQAVIDIILPKQDEGVRNKIVEYLDSKKK
jgi:hypothetical protein